MRLAPLILAALALAGPAAVRAAQEATPAFAFTPEPSECEGEYAVRCTVASAKWPADAEARIAFDIHDDGSFHTLRISGKGLSLGRVRPDRVVDLGSVPTFRPPKRFELVLQRGRDHVAVLVDGQRILSADPAMEPVGRIGSGVSGAVSITDLLLQPTGDLALSDDFTRDTTDMATWEVLEGKWANTVQASEGFLSDFTANPFAFRADAAPRAMARTGEWFWIDYSIGVSVRPVSTQAVGLAAHVHDPANLVLLRWRAGGNGDPDCRQLSVVRNGKEQVLASAPGGYVPGQWYRLALRVGGRRVTAFINGFPCLSAETPLLSQGPGAICAWQGQAFFDDVTVAHENETPDPPVLVPEQFAKDELMQQLGVTNPRTMWLGPTNGAFWYWGLFPEQARIELPLAPLQGQQATIVMRGDGANPSAAYMVGLQWANDALSIDLKRAGESIDQRSVPCPSDGVVEAEVDSGLIRVLVDGRSVYERTDPTPLAGAWVGAMVPDVNVLAEAIVTSRHQLDDTFTSAPTHWLAAKGTWGVDVRWPCDRRWAFFGGKDDENPTVWSKQVLKGDVAVETFAAVRMDIPHCPGYSHPSDLCITLCGNGRDVGSGYSFIYAGFNNTKSCILRQGQVVAEAPGQVFQGAVNTNLEFQRAWFRLRAEKIGNRLRLYLRDTPICEYHDPDPLPDGQAALWSYRNGPIYARVRTWASGAEPAPLPRVYSALPATPAPYRWPEGLLFDFEQNTGEFHATAQSGTRVYSDPERAATGKRSLKVVNTVSGGPFAAYAIVEPFCIADWPELSFDYAIPPNVRVNLYLYARQAWHAIELTGGAPEDSSRVRPIGRIPDVVADGQFHSARLSLKEAFVGLYPDSRIRVAAMAFASPETVQDYVRCGIGGNAKDSAYWIDNFRLGVPGAPVGR
ncbi:MAG TPA: hypothetical protein PLD23_05890 [Armatimonadota bacterium]|mgnify:CR=1 FL=1|nr:hypothetical protein [Armatimonadota bacterium]